MGMVMTGTQFEPRLYFVWRASDIRPEIVALSERSGCHALFDLAGERFSTFQAAVIASAAKHVKLSVQQVLDSTLTHALHAAKIQSAWFEVNPGVLIPDRSGILERLDELARTCEVVVITGDLATLKNIVATGSSRVAVAIKGCEASGVVGSETTSILVETVEGWQAAPQDRKAVNIWGGIATPEAAAAFFCSGIRGIVCESLHWLTQHVDVSDERRKRLAALNADNTVLVGKELGVACRFFDRGNSLAVKRLRQFLAALVQAPVSDRNVQVFFDKVFAEAVHPLDSDFSRDQLIPLGPEAAFADRFAGRFGRTTPEALEGFRVETERICRQSSEILRSFFADSHLNQFGTRYPFIQGAMTWITDQPGFALEVAQAGGLPTLALGIHGAEGLQKQFLRLDGFMREHACAVNVLAIPENPVLKEQLEWIKQMRPPLVVIAGGTVSHVAPLKDLGIRVMTIVASDSLMRLALEAGVDGLIIEGYEAGGHVGPHSSLTLAQMALDLRRSHPKLFANKTVALAGGIFNRRTVFRAAMLGAQAVQMGTAYLATREIVSTGALSSLYQRKILDSGPGETMVTGEAAGLRVRSLVSPKMLAIRELESELVGGKIDEREFRLGLEAANACSLRIAARGTGQDENEKLSEKMCLQQGQFMSGASAGNIDQAFSIEELHAELSGGRTDALAGRSPSPRSPGLHRHRSRNSRDRIAITGLALTNALGNAPQTILEASLQGRSGITEVPLSRWDHQLIFDPAPGKHGKTYCPAGAFHNLSVSRQAIGIPPQYFRTMTSSTRLTLWLAHQALNDSGLLSSDIPRHRIGVVISQNSGEVGSTINDLVIGVEAEKIVESLIAGDLLPTALRDKALRAVRADRLFVDDTTLLGRLNSTASGFICNHFGFRGPSWAVSAACATSLVALFSAIHMIRSGTLDAALVGGGEEILHRASYLEFSAVGALAGMSRNHLPPSRMSRPFDARRDGMVLGEGGGMLVVERESEARRRGARIYGYITGIGASNSDQGMVEPLAETQRIAIAASFEDAGYAPAQVDLVECHATGTVLGDLEEVKALKSIFPRRCGVRLASFKSQIGHTLGASGINSLIRGMLAMRSGVFPGNLNYDAPDARIDLEGWGFHYPTQPVEWSRPQNRPRRLEVNAFGFGGANYVVQLEACEDSDDTVIPNLRFPVEQGIPVADADALCGLRFYSASLNGGDVRLAILADSDEEARAKLRSQLASRALEHAAVIRSVDLLRDGIFIDAPTAAPVPMGFVFSGQGTFYSGMGQELYERSAEIRAVMDRLAGLVDYDLLSLLFHSSGQDMQKTLWQQPALYILEMAIARFLTSKGVRPVAMAGHSMGELVALAVAGVFSAEDGFRLVNERARCMEKAGATARDPGAMLAVDAPRDVLEPLIQEGKLHITNINSPRQIVVGGGTQSIAALERQLIRLGHWTARLKVGMAFHSPIMKAIRDDMQRFLSGIEFHRPSIPVLSNTTRQIFPDDPVAIKRIVMAHLESPVYWLDNVRSLWNDFGVRLFVEIGPADTLSSLIRDTYEEADCLTTCRSGSELRALQRSLGRLFVSGYMDCPGALPRIDISAEPTRPRKAPGGGESSGADARVRDIIQSHLNDFLIERFGDFIVPGIVDDLRRRVDPAFTAERLEYYLKRDGEGKTAGIPAASRRSEGGIPAGLNSPQISCAAGGGNDSHLEQVIRIIMEATGYERHEIEPEMDLRNDLSIRSSRLPVIMNALEQRFGLTIRLEDFIEVRTIMDLSTRIRQLTANPAASAIGQSTPVNPPPLPKPGGDEDDVRAESRRPPVRRLVFRETPLPAGNPRPLDLGKGDRIALISAPDSSLAGALGRELQQAFGASIALAEFNGGNPGAFPINLSGHDGFERQVQAMFGDAEFSGAILAVDDRFRQLMRESEDVEHFFGFYFQLLKAFLRSPRKRFCVAMGRTGEESLGGAAAWEGILGMFLAAAHEYPSVVFRAAMLDPESEIVRSMAAALDPEQKVVEMYVRAKGLFTTAASPEPQTLAHADPDRLRANDVVVIAGGARGITAHISKAIARHGCRLVLLGRTIPDPAIDYRLINSLPLPRETAIARWLAENRPGNQAHSRQREIEEITAGAEVTATVDGLRSMGAEVEYIACDVTSRDQVRRAIEGIGRKYGRVDAVIHGAGSIADSFLQFMDAETFARVVKAKFCGAWNLFQEGRLRGLRLLVGISSLSAAQGNVGQVNYSCANRAMAGMIRTAGQSSPVRGLTFWLPPLRGAGMADKDELRELMALRGMTDAYVGAATMAELIDREIFLGPSGDDWVMPVRKVGPSAFSLVNLNHERSVESRRGLSMVSLAKGQFPMIDHIESVSWKHGHMMARRTFSIEGDPWLEDHKPFVSMKHPWVSAIMAIECCLEAVHLLFPQFGLRGLSGVKFLHPMEIRPDQRLEIRISCRLHEANHRGVQISVRMLSPQTGETTSDGDPHAEALVMAGALSAPPLGDVRDFEINGDSARNADSDQVQSWYRSQTGLGPRYRVIATVEAWNDDLIRGSMVYRLAEDLAGGGETPYLYSPYLLEGLMHLAVFHGVLGSPRSGIQMLPFAMERVWFARKCRAGEPLQLFARHRLKNDTGQVWDAWARDGAGEVIMQVRGLQVIYA